MPKHNRIFIQPAYVVKLLSQNDFDGFNNRQLYACPAERDLAMLGTKETHSVCPKFNRYNFLSHYTQFTITTFKTRNENFSV